MKTTVVLAVILAGMIFLGTGCATPAYTADERNRLISRNWGYEGRQAVDDIDALLLLRPASRLTMWNVR